MLEIKFLEIRDRGTCIPAMAVNLNPLHTMDNPRAFAIIKHGGFGNYNNILLTRLDLGHSQYDPYEWPKGARTLPCTHDHLIKKWGEIKDGDVIDVEFILGEKEKPKTPEII